MRSLGVCLAVLLASGDVWSAPPRGPTTRDRTIAAANRAVEERRLGEALVLWRGLWDVERSPEAACNVGQLASRKGELTTAREFLQICVRLDPREAHRIELGRVEAHLGRLSIRAATDVVVRVDGRELDSGVREVWVEQGSHIAEIERAGRRASTRVQVAPGERQIVTLELSPDRPAPPVAPRPPPQPAPPPPQRGPTWPIYAGLAGAGLAAVAGGTALAVAEDRGVAAKRQAFRINPTNGCDIPQPGCDEVRETAESSFTLRTVAIGAFIGAALLGAGTGIYWVVQPSGASVTVGRQW
ncbi:tetratricopeptide repeat protein [Sorangium sp. So ce388]|uniref:tetratricopeptide repeat protein n=1 Tax=Sorangium sp. So ce388 TaxID=3133309 RepID=UPI003F5B7CB2